MRHTVPASLPEAGVRAFAERQSIKCGASIHPLVDILLKDLDQVFGVVDAAMMRPRKLKSLSAKCFGHPDRLVQSLEELVLVLEVDVMPLDPLRVKVVQKAVFAQNLVVKVAPRAQ